jgi:hypothetical protein
MNCGPSVRQPPRRLAAAGRIASVLCLFLLALALSSGPAGAYPCDGSAGPARTLSAHIGTEVKECTPAPKRAPLHRKADPISFAFFIGLIVAVLLVPVARLSKREYSSRE